MNLFQNITISAFSLLLLLTLFLISRRRTAFMSGLFWSLLWVTGLLLVLFPDTTKWLARILGINRGVDVILYAALFAGLVSFFLVSMKFRRVERQITVLTREIALLTADSPAPETVSDALRSPGAEEKPLTGRGQ